ncbi:FecCD family ABC transporter permease [Rudaeicoccus suwonensis]|uniref:Iron complex transport system permease protein n=1 Tax=Rudaeicoccus suwonensis TaxID=657409 RepID=A0A561E814_9MICO|nr:iron chelate uptake ABC transporter family permease subunit [Rudaeicoccus suwonensis]TWE11736.1 iron complex transport system permease protein [Rudaeicoccus suwonensis]
MSDRTATMARTVRVGPTFSRRMHWRPVVVTAIIVGVALALTVVSIGTGDYPMSPAAVIQTLLGHGNTLQDMVVQQLRLPRVATALAVGAALALAGAIMQSLVRNPLGSPDMLGISQGSTTGALLIIVWFGGSTAAVALGALVGGLTVAIVIFALAWRDGLHGTKLILIGVGVGAMLTGCNGYLLIKAQLPDAQAAMLWLTGSLDAATWGDAIPVAIALSVVVIALACGYGRSLAMLELGDDTAGGLGVRVQSVRLTLLAAAAILTALAAAAAGPVAFVALVSPQIARRLVRTPGPQLIPSMCLGAALMVAADLLATRLIPDNPLPVGVMTGLLGGIYLVGLLVSRRRAGLI